MARIEISNIGGGATLSLTTTGTSGASTLAGSVLNIPVYQGQLTLTTTGTSGAATLSGDILNIPNYATGGSPAGSTGEIQYNNAGAFGASSNLAWDNSNVRLNIGAPPTPTGRLNVRGGGTTSATVTQVWTNSGNTELMRVRDDGNVGIGNTSPSSRLSITAQSDQSALSISGYNVTGANIQPAIDISGTWNTTASPAAIRANITNTASGSQSSLLSLQIGSVTRFSVRNDGVIFFGPNSAATSSIRATTDGTVQYSSGLGSVAGDEHLLTNGNVGTPKAHTSGTLNAIRTNIGFSPTSGTGVFNGYVYNATINQTGGANGISRGFYINPVLTSAADWRSVEFSNNIGWGIFGSGTAKSYFAGNVAIGTTSQNASSAFEVSSTTQGVLFPRMTTTQRNAITTPADGLVIYNTTDNKLQVRAAGVWVDLH